MLASSSLNQNIRLSPVTQGNGAARFGAYTDEQGPQRPESTGQDILVGEGTTLCASADGVVAGPGTHPQWGATPAGRSPKWLRDGVLQPAGRISPRWATGCERGDVIGAAQGTIVHFELWKGWRARRSDGISRSMEPALAVLGVPIRIHWTLRRSSLALVIWGQGGAAAVGRGAMVLHELGHTLVARAPAYPSMGWNPPLGCCAAPWTGDCPSIPRASVRWRWPDRA